VPIGDNIVGKRTQQSIEWKCGNLMLFRSSLSLESTLYLYCLDLISQTFLIANSTTKTLSLIIPKSLSNSNFIDVLPAFRELSQSDKSHTLEDNIMVVYKPIKSDQFLVYPKPSVANNSYFPKIPFAMTSKRISSNITLSNASDITEHKVLEFGRTDGQFHYGVHKAVSDAGGIEVFMFLFAHIIDTTSDEKLQSKGLEIMLKSV